MEKQKKECDNCKKYQDQAFELEVDEDLNQERLQQFWKKYSWLVYVTVVLVLLATAGIQLYQSWHMKLRLAESDIFENAVVQLFAHKEQPAIDALTQLAETGKTGYRYMARLELAGIYARSNKQAEALEQLNILMKSNAPKALKNTATLAYVGHKVESTDTAEMLDLLDPLLKNPVYVGLATELATAIYLNQNKPEEAIKVLQTSLAMPNLPEETKARLQALKQNIENK